MEHSWWIERIWRIFLGSVCVYRTYLGENEISFLRVKVNGGNFKVTPLKLKKNIFIYEDKAGC